MHQIFLTWKRLVGLGSLQNCVDSWHRVSPENEVRLYTDADCLRFVEEEFPEFLPTYLSYPAGILRADIWRVLVLYRYGGVYADIDVECLRPLDELLGRIGHDDWELLLTTDHPVHNRIHFGGQKMWMNDFMIAKPGARFLKRVIDAFVAQGGGDHLPANAVFVTGPGLFTKLVEVAGGPEAAGITEIPWEWVHPLPDMSNEFAEKEEYDGMIRQGTWKQRFDPVVVHYWHHTWCKSGNTLQQYSRVLLTQAGELVEERLQRFVPYLGKRLETMGMALAEFAQRGGGTVVELGVMRSFVSEGHPGCMVAEAAHWEPKSPGAWDWGAGAFTKLAAEVLKGLDFEYHGIDPSADALGIAQMAVEGTPGVQVELEAGRAEHPKGMDTEHRCSDGYTLVRPTANMAFHLTTAGEYLRQRTGQVALVYMDHGESSEATAVMHGEDARLLLQRNLVLPGGLVCIDDHQASIPKSKYSLPLFLEAGFRVVAEGYQILLEKPLGPELEIPRILHRFPPDLGLAQSGTVDWFADQKVGSAWDLPGWEVRDWTLQRLDAFMEASGGEWVDSYFQLKHPSVRLRAGRYAVLAKQGGVAVVGGTPQPAHFPDFLAGHRLACFCQMAPRENLLDEKEALSPRIMASTVGHPFWEGMAEDWKSGDPNDTSALRSKFLTRRVRESMRHLEAINHPVALNLPEFISVGGVQRMHPRKSMVAFNGGTGSPLAWDYDRVFPELSDEMCDAYERNATEREVQWIRDQFAVQEIIGKRDDAHVAAVSLFWKPVDDWMPDPGPPSMSALKTVPLRNGTAWQQYVEPLLSGAKRLSQNAPEVTLRVYLANDLEFLVPELAAWCEIHLMKSSSIRAQPGTLWRFSAMEDHGGKVTILDADLLQNVGLTYIKRTDQLLNTRVQSWRGLSATCEIDESKSLVYRPIVACGFGASTKLPIARLREAFLWHSLKQNLATHTTHPSTGKVPFFGTTWPNYGFDEWFLLHAVHRRLLQEGCDVYMNGAVSPILFPLDIALATRLNVASQIYYC